MILCEQCGNEFYYTKRMIEYGDTPKVQCPYCRNLNPLPRKNKKHKGDKHNK